MRPILFTIYGRKIYSYLVMLYIGLVAGVFAGAAVAESSGISANRFVIATLILIVPALAGARLLYVAMNWRYYRKNPRLIWRDRKTGAALYGGLILVIASSIVLLRALEIPFWRYWDAGIVTMLVGMVFTRIGCVLNGCCCGRYSNRWFALRMPNTRGEWRRRVPTQIIESVFALGLASAAVFARPYAPFAGVTFLSAVALYSAGRFVFQGLREDPTGGRYFRAGRAASLSMAAAAVAAMMVIIFRH
jgi:phosphatidylglycerol:prolipoprotein diacylglycerol transferase